jgi:hypothetical protein
MRHWVWEAVDSSSINPQDAVFAFLSTSSNFW